MDHSRPRPVLPGSTPAPAPAGKTSVYMGTLAPHFDPSVTGGRFVDAYGDETMMLSGSTVAATQYRKSQERAISKIVNKLPFDLRDSVTSIVNMTLSASEIAQKNLEISNHELIDMRNELSKKCVELETTQKTLQIYREKLRGQHEALGTLRDDLNVKAVQSLRNQKYLARLSSTNKMLIGSLNALDVVPPSPEMRSADKKTRAMTLKPMSFNDQQPESSSSSSSTALAVAAPTTEPSSRAITPAITGKISGVVQNVTLNQPSPAPHNKDAALANERLRASLLRVAREHYISQKLAEGLERKIDELRHTLRDADQRNRVLANELNELRSQHSDESTGQAGAAVSTRAGAAMDRESAVKVRAFGKIDDRFKSCMKREVLNAEQALLTTRRILEFMSHAPTGASLDDAALFLSSKEASQLFGAEMVAVIIKAHSGKLDGSGFDAVRYTMRSAKPEHLVIRSRKRGEGRCVAYDTMSMGHPSRMNNLSRVGSFDPDVDVCAGVLAQRILSIPLRDCDSVTPSGTSSGTVIGALHFINKSNGDTFSEADELMALVFADHASSLLTHGRALGSALNCLDTYRRVLEAAVSIYRVVPDPASLTAAKEFGVTPAAILYVLEDVCKDALRCLRTKAFIVSDAVAALAGDPTAKPLSPSCLLMLDHNAKGTARGDVVAVAAELGVAGYVLASRAAFEISDSSSDDRLNPQIDLEVIGEPVISVPVVDMAGCVLAVLQFTPGANSPKTALPIGHADKPENELLFAQAAQWLALQLVNPLRYLFFLVGREAERPSGVPLLFAERRLAPYSPPAPAVVRSALFGGSSGATSESKSSTQALAAAAALESSEALAEERRSLLVAAQSELTALRAQVLASANRLSTAESLVSDKDAAVGAAATAAAAAATAAATATAATLQEREGQLAAAGKEMALLRHKLSQAEALAEAAVASAAGEGGEVGVASASTAAAAPTLADTQQQEKLDELQKQIGSLQSSLQIKTQEVEAALAASKKSLSDAIDAAAASDKARVEAIAESKALLDKLAVAQAHEASLAEELKKQETEVMMLTILHKQLDDARATSADQAAALEQKDSVIVILQEQLIKMAEESLKGSDMTALKESLAQSMAQASAVVGTGGASSRPGTRGGASAKPPTGSRPPTSAKAPQPSAADLTGMGGLSLNVAFPWTELVDDANNKYYYNQETGESSWEQPVTDAGAGLGEHSVSSNVTHGDYLECYDADGNLYYVNQITGESTWELPEVVSST